MLDSILGFMPILAQAGGVDLNSGIQAGKDIIMQICALLAGVGIVGGGIALMGGKPVVAKWAIAGGVVCGLAFLIVKAIWSATGNADPGF